MPVSGQQRYRSKAAAVSGFALPVRVASRATGVKLGPFAAEPCRAVFALLVRVGNFCPFFWLLHRAFSALLWVVEPN